MLIKQVAVGTAAIMFVTLLGTGIWYGTRIDALTIDTITVSGGDTISHETIRALAESQLAGSYFALVPHRFAWTYPEEVLKEQVLQTERVKDVMIIRDDTELRVSFTEYTPAALWCAVDGTTCLFLDEYGYAFSEAPSLTGSSLLRYSDPIRTPEEGAYAFDAEAGAFFTTLSTLLYERYGFSVVAITVLAPREVAMQLSRGGELKVTLDRSIEETMTNLATILESDEFRHLQNSPFAYIDLRYGNRVFVNEKGDVPVPEENIEGDEGVEAEAATSDDAAE